MIYTETTDGLTLEALAVDAPRSVAGRAPLIWLHGVHLKFCEPEYVALAQAFAARGRSVILANTRGQGFGTWLRGRNGTVIGGSAWETFQDCVADVDAWIRVALARHGTTQVVLGGHGYGGTKAVYHVAERRDSRVAAIIAASSGSLTRDTLDPGKLDEARAMLEAGRGLELMPFGTLRGSLAATVSAAAYANRVQVHRDLYGSEQVAPVLSRLEAPLLAFFGALEQTEARDVASFLASIARNAVRARLVETDLIDEAGYFFSGRQVEIAARVERFLTRAEALDRRRVSA